MNFLEKLDSLMQRNNLNKHTLSEKSGIPYTTIDGWYKRGYEGAKISTIIRLADFFGVELDFLVKRDNNPGLSLNPEEIHILNNYRSLDTRGKLLVNAVIKKEAALSQEAKKAPAEEAHKVEMLVYNFPAAAGVPMYAEDDSFERLDFPISQVPRGADFGIRISGDSMQPTIPAGAIVFVRKTAELRPGDIGIFMVDDEAACKRFSMDHRGIVLKPDNPAYPEIIIQPFQRFAITGKVLGYK